MGAFWSLWPPTVILMWKLSELAVMPGAQEHQGLGSSSTTCSCVEVGPESSPKGGPGSDHRSWVAPYHMRSPSGFLTSPQGGLPNLSPQPIKAGILGYPSCLLPVFLMEYIRVLNILKSIIKSKSNQHLWAFSSDQTEPASYAIISVGQNCALMLYLHRKA